jgi:hypothetical protein
LPRDCDSEQLRRHFDKYDGTVCPVQETRMVAAMRQIAQQAEGKMAQGRDDDAGQSKPDVPMEAAEKRNNADDAVAVIVQASDPQPENAHVPTEAADKADGAVAVIVQASDPQPQNDKDTQGSGTVVSGQSFGVGGAVSLRAKYEHIRMANGKFVQKLTDGKFDQGQNVMMCGRAFGTEPGEMQGMSDADLKELEADVAAVDATGGGVDGSVRAEAALSDGASMVKKDGDVTVSDGASMVKKDGDATVSDGASMEQKEGAPVGVVDVKGKPRGGVANVFMVRRDASVLGKVCEMYACFVCVYVFCMYVYILCVCVFVERRDASVLGKVWRCMRVLYVCMYAL